MGRLPFQRWSGRTRRRDLPRMWDRKPGAIVVTVGPRELQLSVTDRLTQCLDDKVDSVRFASSRTALAVLIVEPLQYFLARPGWIRYLQEVGR
jgi:hypothetical protein